MMPQRIRRTLWLVVWVTFPGVPCVNAATEAGYTSLFNGKDLTGWTPMGVPEAFAVKDDAIYTTGAKPYPSWLRSTSYPLAPGTAAQSSTTSPRPVVALA